MTDIDSDEFREMLLSLKEASEVYQNVERISENFNGKSKPVVLAITTTLLAKVVYTASSDKVSAKALMIDVMSRAVDILGLIFNEKDDFDDEDDDEDEEKPFQ